MIQVEEYRTIGALVRRHTGLFGSRRLSWHGAYKLIQLSGELTLKALFLLLPSFITPKRGESFVSNAEFRTQTAVVNRVEQSDSEIDLTELATSLWVKKQIIAAVTIAVVVGALLYIWLASPVYNTNMVFKITEPHELSKLNIPNVFSLSKDEALERYRSALASYGQRYLFFKANQDLYDLDGEESLSIEQKYANFDQKSFSISDPRSKKDVGQTFVNLSLSYSPDTQGVKILQSMAAWIHQKELEEIKKGVKNAVESRLRDLQLELKKSRKQYSVTKEAQIAKLLEKDEIKRQNLIDEKAAIQAGLVRRRENRIRELSEAIEVAKSLGIKNAFSTMVPIDSSSTGSIDDKIIASLPLYFLGTKALASERKILLARKSDDFVEPRLVEIDLELKLLEKNRFVENLRVRSEGNEDIYLNNLAEIEKSIAGLKAITFDFDNVRLVKIDREAIAPIRPVKPKKLLILFIAIVIGVMLGIFAALSVHLFETAKERNKSLSWNQGPK